MQCFTGMLVWDRFIAFWCPISPSDFSEQDNYSIYFSIENCKENGNNNERYELSEKCTHVQVEPGTYVIK